MLNISSAPPPSSNRTCRFPPSGSHASTRHPNGQHTTRYREAVTLQSPRREILQHPTGHLRFRSGICIQAGLLTSYRSTLTSRPLRSTVVTRFHATMSLSDSRSKPACGYVFPQTVGGSPTTQPGLPGSSTNLSTRAVPYHPGESDKCTRPLLLCRWQASASWAEWPLPIGVTRPKWVRLRYGSRVRHTSPRSPDYS